MVVILYLILVHSWNHNAYAMFTGCNFKKTVLNTIINKSISRSRTVEHIFSDQVIDGTVVEMVSEIKILCVILDSKLAFVKQVRAIAASAMREGWYFEEDDECFSRCCCCCQMLLGIHTPCAIVLFSIWISAVTSHLLLLDRDIGRVSQLSG